MLWKRIQISHQCDIYATETNMINLNSSPLGQNEMEIIEFWFEFHSNLFSNWQLASIGSGNGLLPVWHQAITWTNTCPVHWHTYAPLGGDELIW